MYNNKTNTLLLTGNRIVTKLLIYRLYHRSYTGLCGLYIVHIISILNGCKDTTFYQDSIKIVPRASPLVAHLLVIQHNCFCIFLNSLLFHGLFSFVHPLFNTKKTAASSVPPLCWLLPLQCYYLSSPQFFNSLSNNLLSKSASIALSHGYFLKRCFNTATASVSPVSVLLTRSSTYCAAFSLTVSLSQRIAPRITFNASSTSPNSPFLMLSLYSAHWRL